MMLAPLVVLGLEQLIKEKKVLLYYISLSLCIISNYYIAIMAVSYTHLDVYKRQDKGAGPGDQIADGGIALSEVSGYVELQTCA